MTGLGDWDTTGTTPDATPPPSAPPPVSEAVAELARRAVHTRLADLAADAIDDTLTTGLTEAQWQQLDQAARAAVRDLFTPPTPETPPQMYYPTVDDFVREFLCQTFRRPVGPGSPLRWSARWWESAEAIIRLDAIWRAWEALRLDPATGMSVWVKDHADYHLAVLMSPTGPFRNSEDTAKITEPLPYEPPPAGLFVAPQS